MYDFDNNRLYFETKDGIIFDLNMRKNKCIVRGNSGTGKTYICDYISAIQQSYNALPYKYENVFILNRLNIYELQHQTNKLIIIDRGDLIINDDIKEFINTKDNNNYLIFARSVLGIDASPNYYAELCLKDNVVHLEYSFSERGWF